MDVLANITEIEVTEAGSIPLGFLFASLKNVGDTPALVNGVTLAPGEAKGYPFVGKPHNIKSFDPLESRLLVMYVI